MQKIAIGLSALLLTATVAKPGAAQEANTAARLQSPPACVQYVAEYMGCLNYGDLTEAQARTARGHPLFVERQAATAAQAREPSTTSDRLVHASRIGPPSRQ